MEPLRKKPKSKFEMFKEHMITKYEPLRNIDDDLLWTALTKNIPSHLASEEVRQVTKKYGSATFDRLEFLGDGVLDQLVIEIVFNDFNLKTSGDLTKAKSRIVNNVALYCLANHKFYEDFTLCSMLVINSQFWGKDCADLFEALIGAIYYHIRLQNNEINAFSFVEQWLDTEFNFTKIVNYLLANPEATVCNYLREPEPDPEMFGRKARSKSRRRN